MADEKKTTWEKLVELRIPRGRSNEEPCLMIGVNGKNWLLPKGETSKVPEYVAEEYHRSVEAVDSYSAKINNIQGEEQAVNASARARIGG
nr:MAG TPA: hypothetical protein [Caudoviricetes sp.]DAP13259.1 MAG TPA: hypothetical protein [Caudoviricetes sp.]